VPMRISFVSQTGIEEHPWADLDALLGRTDGFTWIDVPEFDADAEEMLRDTLKAHPLVVSACRERNFVPAVHSYAEHVFVVVHTTLTGEAGHVHLLELDQLVGAHYLVTVHGPRNPAVELSATTAETDGIRQRIEAGRFHPASPAELFYAIGSAVARRHAAAVRAVANQLPALEARVMGPDFTHPEVLLDELFLLRHELLTARTAASQAHDIHARLASLQRFTSDELRQHAGDLAEQFERARNVADGESQFLFGIIDLYQTRVTTKMTVAMERLAVIAAVTLPVTAIASIYGMNVIVSQKTHIVHLSVVLLAMAAISGVLLHWTKRQGWW
jgi:Mg2+ and Co2+ transporter CorA